MLLLIINEEIGSLVFVGGIVMILLIICLEFVEVIGSLIFWFCVISGGVVLGFFVLFFLGLLDLVGVGLILDFIFFLFILVYL